MLTLQLNNSPASLNPGLTWCLATLHPTTYWSCGVLIFRASLCATAFVLLILMASTSFITNDIFGWCWPSFGISAVLSHLPEIYFAVDSPALYEYLIWSIMIFFSRPPIGPKESLLLVVPVKNIWTNTSDYWWLQNPIGPGLTGCSSRLLSPLLLHLFPDFVVLLVIFFLTMYKRM